MERKVKKTMYPLSEENFNENADNRIMIFSEKDVTSDMNKTDELVNMMETNEMLMVIQKENYISMLAPIDMDWMFFLKENENRLFIKKI